MNDILEAVIVLTLYFGIWALAYASTYFMEWYAVKKQREEKTEKLIEDLAGFEDEEKR